ncbi:MAG: hypothetical protein ACYCYI_11835 [Saccharofermentanales bacterium]
MKILTRSIVSNSEMIKNYKTCREKTDELGMIYIFKNNQPDAVLLSISEYSRLAPMIEYMERFGEEDIKNLAEYLQKEQISKKIFIDTSTKEQ